MKSVTIPILQHGIHIKLQLQFARNRRYTFEELEQFVKENCGNDAEIENPDKFRKHLSKLK